MQRILILSTIIIALVMGGLFSTSCSTDSSGPTSIGKLTFTDIPENFNGSYISGIAFIDTKVLAFADVAPNIDPNRENGESFKQKGVLIKGSYITLNVYVWSPSSGLGYKPYTGSDTVLAFGGDSGELGIVIYIDDNPAIEIIGSLTSKWVGDCNKPVTFINGSAEVSYNDFAIIVGD